MDKIQPSRRQFLGTSAGVAAARAIRETEHATARSKCGFFIRSSPLPAALVRRPTYLDVYSPLALGDCQAQDCRRGTGDWG